MKSCSIIIYFGDVILSCIVQKFGGTSVATIDRIKNVADIIARSKNINKNIVVVVSAMAGVTNKFVKYANDLSAFEGDPEYDSVVSAGELVTSGLVAIALKNIGLKSRSYTSWQVPIFTNSTYGSAEILGIDPRNLLRDLEDGIIPVICGFQGVCENKRVTTFGRGGSDLTAVAISAAVNANMCEIYSDVDGVYTVDPNLYTEAKIIKKLCYREMLEMASQGAKVLQEQSVDYAMKKNVVVRVTSSFIDSGGTIISSSAPLNPFCGIAVTHNLSQIVVTHNNKDTLVKASNTFKNNKIKAEIFHNEHPQKINIMVSNKLTNLAIDLIKKLDFVIDVEQKITRSHFSKISVIGASITGDIGKDMEKELKKNKINPFGTLSNEYRSNIIIASNQLLNSIAVLHNYCGLDK